MDARKGSWGQWLTNKAAYTFGTPSLQPRDRDSTASSHCLSLWPLSLKVALCFFFSYIILRIKLSRKKKYYPFCQLIFFFLDLMLRFADTICLAYLFSLVVITNIVVVSIWCSLPLIIYRKNIMAVFASGLRQRHQPFYLAVCVVSYLTISK